MKPTELTVDCHAPERLAAFWCEVLDFKVIDRSEDTAKIGSWVPTVEDVRARQMSPTLLFIPLVAAGRIDLAAADTALFAMRTSSSTLNMMMRTSARLFRMSLFMDDWAAFLRTAHDLRTRRGTAKAPSDGPAVISARNPRKPVSRDSR
ncbi:VOC family protein [Streptomyces atratus]|uniref:VOC family protein n=1 Tax=Streptomyces atratus TaxID=1893 RepID=UPI00367F8110